MRPVRPQKLTRAALLVCAIWPVIIGVLWATTARTVPLIKVRWVPGVADGTRSATERDLSLVWRDSTEPRTVTYLLTDSDQENVRRIVHHPLVEDTAFIDRATYALSNPPMERTWAGERFTTRWPWALRTKTATPTGSNAYTNSSARSTAVTSQPPSAAISLTEATR